MPRQPVLSGQRANGRRHRCVARLAVLFACALTHADPPRDFAYEGVRVHFDFTPADFRRATSQGPFEGTPLPRDSAAIPTAAAAARAFVDSLQPSPARQWVSDVYVFEWLEFKGAPAGGGYSRDAVFLGMRWTTRVTLSEREAYAQLHAEFSSIVMLHAPFPTDDWVKTLPPGLASPAITDLLRSGEASVMSRELISQGFFTKYSSTSIENDANTLVFGMLALPCLVEDARRRSPRISEKVELLTGYYASIGLRLTSPRRACAKAIRAERGAASPAPP